MSTFGGKLKEIPEISIDRFDNNNKDAEAFFLSHCHSDHMIGLNDLIFQQFLIDSKRKLYLSCVSAAILKISHPKIAESLMELDPVSPTTIELSTKYITVLPIPAGHCPGSIMFLFEVGGMTVLYTGDYRINPRDLPKIKGFYDNSNEQKSIDAVYLDTTFFLKEYEKFPTREESLKEICQIIAEWLKKGDRYVAGLRTSAQYGYEYLFIEIYNYFKIPVHVNKEIYDLYSRIPTMDQTITTDKNQTRIHCACGTTYDIICPNTVYYNVKTIRISALPWRNYNLKNGISKVQRNTHFVCYSTHASYEEGLEFLKFLKPNRIYANVLGKNEILENIKEFQHAQTIEARKMELFEIVNGRTSPKQFKSIQHGSPEIFDSPPRKMSLGNDENNAKMKLFEPCNENILLDFLKPSTSADDCMDINESFKNYIYTPSVENVLTEFLKLHKSEQ